MPTNPSLTKRRVMVTGGLGFIGSYFVKLLLEKGYAVINVDKKTYAARKDVDFDSRPDYELIEKDICDLVSLPPNLDYIVNFAAESHVDNSILANQHFFHSNVQGVYNLLELVRAKEPSERPIFIQISTDEVYGDISQGSFTETDPLKPSSPYSSTKAAAEQLVFGWSKTYNLKTRICRSCNNYGFGQYAEKLIPRTIKYTYKNKKMIVHGDGSYKREWIQAEDNCEAILCVMERGQDGEIYNISTGEEYSNLEIVKIILKTMNVPEDHFTFVENRPGQDVRYSVTSEKIKQLGWAPKHTFVQYLPVYLELCDKKIENISKTIGKKRYIVTKIFGEKIARFIANIIRQKI